MVEFEGLAGSLTVPNVPYHELIVADIRTRIASGEWPPGSVLPSTRLLLEIYGERFGVKAAATVRKAVEQLQWEGVLIGHQGLQVTVANPQPRRPE